MCSCGCQVPGGTAGGAACGAGRSAGAGSAAGLRRHPGPRGAQVGHSHNQARHGGMPPGTPPLRMDQQGVWCCQAARRPGCAWPPTKRLLPCRRPTNTLNSSTPLLHPPPVWPPAKPLKRPAAPLACPLPHAVASCRSIPELEFEIGAGAYVPFAGDLTTVADVLMRACKNLNMNQAGRRRRRCAAGRCAAGRCGAARHAWPCAGVFSGPGSGDHARCSLGVQGLRRCAVHPPRVCIIDDMCGLLGVDRLALC